MKVIGYARVSTEEQAREGFSLGAQCEQIEAYCGLHGLELVDLVQDAGESGKDLCRPGWESVDRRLRKRGIGGVVVVKLDRLTRSLQDVLNLVRASRRWGWEIHSVHERLDTSSAMGRFFVQMLGSIAELERERISERVSEGMSKARREGRRLGSVPPYGYRFEGDEVVPEESEQRVLSVIEGMDGAGSTAIARELNRLGVRTRCGGEWRQQYVHRLLKRMEEAVQTSSERRASA